MKLISGLTVLVCLWIVLPPPAGWADAHFRRGTERGLRERGEREGERARPSVVQKQLAGMMAQMAGFLRQTGHLLRRGDLTPQQTTQVPPLLDKMATLLDDMRNVQESPPGEELQDISGLMIQMGELMTDFGELMSTATQPSGGRLDAPPSKPTASGKGIGSLKIVAPGGGGIYLGSFTDLGFYYQIAGNYDGSGLPAGERRQFYGKTLDQMFGKKFAIAPIVSPLIRDEGVTAEGRKPGKLMFDVGGHKKTWEQHGYVTRFALGDINVPRVFREINTGLWDTRIDYFAQRLNSYPYPVFVNYWIEADIAGLVNVARDFKAAIRRIHDRVEAIAPNKVTWVAPTISINIDRPKQIRGKPVYQIFYPGDKYVDWHAFSFFCWNYEATGSSRYIPAGRCLKQMRFQLRGMAKKPVMLEQFGLSRVGPFRNRTDQDRANWFKNFVAEVKNYPEVAAILFVQNDYHGWNTALRVSEPAVQVIKEEIRRHPNYWHSTVELAGGAAVPRAAPVPSSSQ